MGVKTDLSSHLALITGAAGGIGLEFAKVMARGGASLILADINGERLKEAKAIIEQDCPRLSAIHLLQIDLTTDDFIDIIDTFCKERKILPDILINNAGVFAFAPLADTSIKKTEIFVDLHVRAVTLLSQWFVKKRLENGGNLVCKGKAPKGTTVGWLLNMSSMSCWMPMPGLALYSSTKSYIRVFTRALHYETKDYGIGVTVACPGGIATDLFGLPDKWKKFAVSIGVLATPEKFAQTAVKKMLKKRKQYINGMLNRFSIFFIGILPTRVRMMVKHQLLDKGITR